jgi:hypothetical protein
MNAVEHITGAERLIAALGGWPTFHDAEVISFSAQRALPLEPGYSLAQLSVHVRRYASQGEGTAQYQLVLTKSVLVRFAFTGACALELSGFNHQNVIDAITVARLPVEEPANLLVTIDSIWGFGGSLRCSGVEVESVEDLPIN